MTAEPEPETAREPEEPREPDDYAALWRHHALPGWMAQRDAEGA